MELKQCPVTMIQGVSTAKQQELHAFGIYTVADLLYYFPFRYDDLRLRLLSEVKDGEKVTVEGQIKGAPVWQRFSRKSRLICKVLVEDLLVTVIWFNRYYLLKQLTQGRHIRLSGKWDQRRLQITVSTSEFLDHGVERKDTLQPVYAVKGKITQTWMCKIIIQALRQFGEAIPELMPPEFMQRYRLMPRKQAIRAMHMPRDTEEGRQARRRMVYEELLLFQLKLHMFRTVTHERANGVVHHVDHAMMQNFIQSLPFELTEGQKQAIADIVRDMQAPTCMNRLLQGDVGSGKTIVAAMALYATVQAGYQGALMVPTEILAAQHMRLFTQLFQSHGIQIGFLTGSLSARKRKDLLAALQMGIIDIIVGTHALIQDDVYYRKLGLVVTDEQHRFGVNQRSILRRKGLNPDVLLMTATPIPRTLAITVLGDMDVSSLRDRPAGRKVTKTYWVKHSMLDRVLKFIRREVSASSLSDGVEEQGYQNQSVGQTARRQAYIICPLITESDKLDAQNAIEVYIQMQQALPDVHVGLLHGRMTSSEKDEVMHMFNKGEVSVLVSTTVIEVGVDVPNATIMIIMDADRFGLSQLHQLRGRVGRGDHQSYCVLIADPQGEIGRERMRIMTDTTDGFELSERDLQLRGPGDFFGTKQSGMPNFKIADMSNDFAVLEQARSDAIELIGSELYSTAQQYARLRDAVQHNQLDQGELLD